MSGEKKYHVNFKTGEMGLCRAEKGGCPWAKKDPENVQHYGSMQESFEAFEGAMEAEKFSNTVSKGSKGADTAKKPETPLDKVKRKYPALDNPVAPKLEDSKILKAPNIDPNGGYLGSSAFQGGKLQEAMDAKRAAEGKKPGDYVYLSQSDRATLVREDLKAAVKAGELPSDLGYTVRQNTGSMVNSLTIVVGKKDGRKIVPVDDSFLYRKADMERRSTGDYELYKDDERALNDYERWHDESVLERVPTDESKQVEAYLTNLGNQWAFDNSNHQVDYFNSSGKVSVRWKNKWD